MSNFITLQEVKDEMDAMGIDYSGFEGDGSYTRLQRVIDNCETEIEKMTHRTWSYQEGVTKYYDGTGKEALVLRDFPIVSITNVTFIYGGYTDIFDSSSFNIDDKKGILFFVNNNAYPSTAVFSLFPIGRRNVEVTGTFGTATIPDDLKEAMLYFIVNKSLKVTPSSIDKKGINSIRIGNLSKSYKGAGVYSQLKADLESIYNPIIRRYTRTLISW